MEIQGKTGRIQLIYLEDYFSQQSKSISIERLWISADPYYDTNQLKF